MVTKQDTKGCHIYIYKCVSRAVTIYFEIHFCFCTRWNEMRRQPLLLNNWINWGHSRQPENVCAVEFIRISECHYFKYLALKHFKILDSFTLSLAFSLKFCWIFVQSHTWNVKRLSNEVMVHGPWTMIMVMFWRTNKEGFINRSYVHVMKRTWKW